MTGRVEGKVALITGGASGIGRAATFAQADVSQATAVEAMISKTVETYGRLDCAHTNAGIASGRQGVHSPPSTSKNAGHQVIASTSYVRLSFSTLCWPRWRT